jgi:hypothetical protein
MPIKRSSFLLIAALSVILLSVAAIVLKSYYDSAENADTDRKSAMGFALSEPVIDALERFKGAKGKYPQNLRELVPEFIEKNPQKEENSEIKFTYFPDDQNNAYRLRFTYGTRYGAYDCYFASKNSQWSCGGTM